MERKLLKRAFDFLAFFILAGSVQAGGTVEVLHGFKDTDDITAVQALRAEMEAKGIQWIETPPYQKKDFDTLNSRVFKNKAPAAVEALDRDYLQWARLGFLANMNEVAATEHWDSLIPEAIADVVKFEGKYVSIPFSIHRSNWFWVNGALLKKHNLKVPKTWKEFDQVADVLTARGVPVLTFRQTDKHRAQMFEALVLSIGGPELYTDTFIMQEVNAFKRPEMNEVFDRFYKLVQLSDKAKQNSEFEFIPSQAAFVIDGDWIVKQTNSNGKEFRDVYECQEMPGRTDQFIFKVDTFVFFNQPNIMDQVVAQQVLAQKLLDIKFQRRLNQGRGALPVRSDITSRGFHECAKKAMIDIKLAEKKGVLVPSVVHGMAVTATVTENFVSLIGQLAEAPESAEDSARKLSRSIRLGQYILR